MPREDPAFLPALPVLTETIAVSDPRIPGKEFEFILAIPEIESESDVWFVYDRTARFEQEYVGDTAKRIDVNGQYIPIERNLCQHIAMLSEAELLATGETWTFPQWAIWKHKAPGAFARLVEAYQELFFKARPDRRPKEESGDSAENGEEESSVTPPASEGIPKNV